MKVTDLKINPKNPRIIKDDRFKKLVKSIEEFPKMMKLRPIIIDGSNMILGGNQRYKAILELKFKDIPDEWVKRADELTEDEKRRFIIADNVEVGEHDWGMLLEDWDKQELEDWGVELPDTETTDEVETENNYSKKIEIPIYEAKNEKPEVNQLYNIERTNQLIQEIENSSVDKEIKQMLIIAAQRHIVFNYSKIADFYAHSDKEIQNLMENSALVIIDFNKALELGYVKLSEQIAEQYKEEYGTE